MSKSVCTIIARMKNFITPSGAKIIIGRNSSENEMLTFQIAKPNDLWFHASHDSSCHVVCEVPDDVEKSDMRYIIKMGAVLCKNNTNKLKSQKNVEIIYTQIKNVTKTAIAGCVQTTNTKMIII
jgi:predicted ribosome quality control (RQC) complex YloA/Tae2 family protein